MSKHVRQLFETRYNGMTRLALKIANHHDLEGFDAFIFVAVRMMVMLPEGY